MIVKYENSDYRLDLDEIEVEHARVIKRYAGLNLRTLEDGLKDGDPDALTSLFWLMLKQSGQDHNIEKVTFKIVKFAKAVGEAQLEEAAQTAIARELAGPKDEEPAAEDL